MDFKNSSSGKVDLVVDLAGGFQTSPAAAYVPIAPTRVLDTRKDLGIAWSGGFGPDASSQLTVTRLASLAAHQILAVAGNLTVTGPTAGGFISLAPPTSSLNFTAGQTIANAVTASLAQGSAQRYLTLYNEADGTTQLIFDIDGYFVD